MKICISYKHINLAIGTILIKTALQGGFLTETNYYSYLGFQRIKLLN